MRRNRPLLLGALLAVVTTTLLGSVTDSTQAVVARTGEVPAPVAAIDADDVVDGFGVGVHLNYLDTPYRDTAAVADALAALGVRHVRDDLYLDAPRQYAAIGAVARRGVSFDLIMGRPTDAATPEDYVDTVAEDLPAGSVDGIEGPNEWDLSGRDDWVAELRDWQHRLFVAAHADPATADIPVLSPALAYRWDYAAVGDLSADADVANAHMYPGGYRPATEIDRITAAVRASLPTEPLVTTETGYHDAVNAVDGHRPVPEDVAGIYMPRLLLEHLARGEARAYTYELLDEFDDPGRTDPEANFGLLHRDFSPKPAYTAMRNLLALLDDPGPGFATTPLPVAADGMSADTRYLLTERRDGRYVLLLWRDVSVFDPDQQVRLPVDPVRVTLRFAGEHALAVVRPSDGSSPVATAVGSSISVPLDGEVSAVVVDPVRPPAPEAVTVTPGDRTATIHWRLPPTSAVVTGLEVRRLGRDTAVRLRPGARTFTDTGLINGQAYRYELRVLGTHGVSAGTRTPAVVPATVPTRPGAVRAAAVGRRVTVTWTAARGQGDPVAAYELTVGGRTVEVLPRERRIAPGVFRATLADRSDRDSARVAVRARNRIGTGPARWSAPVLFSSM